jgi:hypothetical protein
MSQTTIFVDDALLRQRLHAYLRTPQAEPIWDELTTSFGICLFGNLLLLVIHTIQLFTIRWTLDGLKGLWTIVTLQNFRPMWETSRKHPERIHPLLAAGIIVGPDGKHALALGTFQPSSSYSVDWLAAKAAYFGNVYCDGATNASEEPLFALLHDDTYRAYRRRPVPEAYTDGVELYLFDVEVDLHQSFPITAETRLFLFATNKPGESGIIAMVPWAVADEAITVVETV